MHDLFTMILVTYDASNRLFGHISPRGDANYVNAVLTSIYDKISESESNIFLTPNMATHSGRSGPTTAASERPEMQVVT